MYPLDCSINLSTDIDRIVEANGLVSIVSYVLIWDAYITERNGKSDDFHALSRGG